MVDFYFRTAIGYTSDWPILLVFIYLTGFSLLLLISVIYDNFEIHAFNTFMMGPCSVYRLANIDMFWVL